MDSGPTDRDALIRETLESIFGHRSLRPLQDEAIRAGLDRRDSLVVLPTGGGKSLCYQLPPAVDGSTWVVVSPLIALMKDQVDGLVTSGYPAAALHSLMDADAQRQVELDFLAGDLRLLFVAPERLVTPRFLAIAREAGVVSFAIDEAHCISQWGHDFRPEYRRLTEIRRQIPGAVLHAFTATATPRVRADIVAQLGLGGGDVLVGDFDRPNLTYRVVARTGLADQITEVLARHGCTGNGASGGARSGNGSVSGEGAIVYCLSRKDCEKTAEALGARGIDADYYHAGLDPNRRRSVQERFSGERLNVVCATVAFGMGIDRSNVRCVIHACMPASVEAYQQEAGRAGRDGLPAECVLFYAPADAQRWRRFFARPATAADPWEEDDPPPEPEAALVEAKESLLRDMQRYASGVECRHRFLSEYFGQRRSEGSCNACDVCLGELDTVADSDDIAKKICSCLVRIGEPRYGVGHLVDVLTGSEKETVWRRGHDRLSTFALLKDTPMRTVQAFVHQLIDQGAIGRTGDEYPVLYPTRATAEVLKGQRPVRLIETKRRSTRTKADAASWEGVDRELFDRLRAVRTALATERQVPPYVIFSDATLRDLARLRPATRQDMLACHGVGKKKAEDFADHFLPVIAGG